MTIRKLRRLRFDVQATIGNTDFLIGLVVWLGMGLAVGYSLYSVLGRLVP